MDILNTYLFFNPKYKNLSKNHLIFQYKKDLNNSDVIKSFEDFKNKYPDFDIKFYKNINNLNFDNDKKIILHWLNYGLFNNLIISKINFYKIYKDFNYKYYNNYYELKLENEDEIIYHYHTIGRYSNYIINKNNNIKIKNNPSIINENKLNTLNTYVKLNNIKNICHLFVHFFKCGGGEIYIQNFLRYTNFENYLFLDEKHRSYVNIDINVIYYKNKDDLINKLDTNNIDIILDHQYYLYDNLEYNKKLIVHVIHTVDYYKKKINENIKYTINLYHDYRSDTKWNDCLKIINYLGVNKSINYQKIINKLKNINNQNNFEIKNIAIVGRIDIHKININFLSIMIDICKKNNFMFNLYGNIDDKYKNFFLKKIKNIKNIKYHGLILYEEIDNIYLDNDLLLHPSKSEAGGTVLLESMNNGLLSICRNKGGNKETINNDKYLVDDDNEYFIKLIELTQISNNEILKDILKSKKKILLNHNNKYNFKKLTNHLNNFKNIDNSKTIPNIIHYIFGLKKQDEEFSFLFYFGILSNILINKPYKIYFHYQYLPYGYWWNKIKRYLTLNYINYKDFSINDISINHYAHKSDYLRLDILYRYGGVYYDIDTLCIKPHIDLLNNEIVLGIQEKYKNEKDLIGNAIIFSKKKNFFIKMLLDNFEKYFNNDDWTAASLFMTTELYNGLNNDQKNKIKLLKKEYFYYPNYNEDYLVYNNNYEIHDELITYHYCNNFNKLYLKNIKDIGYINNTNFFSLLLRNIYTIYLNIIDNKMYSSSNNNISMDQVSNLKNIEDIIFIINYDKINLKIYEILNRIQTLDNIFFYNINILIYSETKIDKNLKSFIDSLIYLKNLNIYFIQLFNDINIKIKINLSLYIVNEVLLKNKVKIVIINNNDNFCINNAIDYNYDNIIDYNNNETLIIKKEEYKLDYIINIFQIKSIYY